MKQLRTAVIGVGYLGRFHAQKHKASEFANLVAVCDYSFDRAKEIAAEVSCQAVQDYKSLLGQVDAVSIASTTRTHYEIAKFFLSNGVHVNVEKPITSNSAEAAELCQIAKDNNLKLQVGHVERFNPAFTAAREKLKSALFIEVHRLAPYKPRGVDVDVVLDLMIHDLDVILSLVNSNVTKIDAIGVPVLTPYVDIANARLEFENGAVANVTASRVSQTATRKFRVFQQEQYLSLDFGKGEIQLINKDLDAKDSNMPLKMEQWNLDKADALQLETDAFLKAILNNTAVSVPGEDALKALQLAEKICERFKQPK